ncbi:hypothetical protein MJO29_013149 [Puccinia striiformis f. sp. tritici]|nr:hypothetical protein MJO29_013149 [Puccinia striiformis f. sp. tritici]
MIMRNDHGEYFVAAVIGFGGLTKNRSHPLIPRQNEKTKTIDRNDHRSIKNGGIISLSEPPPISLSISTIDHSIINGQQNTRHDAFCQIHPRR